MKYHIQLTDIKKDIEEIFEIPDIADKYRGRELVMSRYLYYILSKQFTFESLGKIGKTVGRDHSSVIHGLNKYEELIKYFDGHKYAQGILEKKYKEMDNDRKAIEFLTSYNSEVKTTFITKRQMELQVN
jgi:hypothetical protein